MHEIDDFYVVPTMNTYDPKITNVMSTELEDLGVQSGFYQIIKGTVMISIHWDNAYFTGTNYYRKNKNRRIEKMFDAIFDNHDLVTNISTYLITDEVTVAELMLSL